MFNRQIERARKIEKSRRRKQKKKVKEKETTTKTSITVSQLIGAHFIFEYIAVTVAHFFF